MNSPTAKQTAVARPGAKRDHKPRPETSVERSNRGYDKVVHAGSNHQDDDDVYEIMERAEGNLETALVDNVDPEALVAAMEDTQRADDAPLDDRLAEQEWSERYLVDVALRPNEDDDGGNVSPEELGEQFLRGAAQQERRTSVNDRESGDNIDLRADSVHQVSLFDHNQDPLAEPRLPTIDADETDADAQHHAASTRSKARQSGAKTSSSQITKKNNERALR